MKRLTPVLGVAALAALAIVLASCGTSNGNGSSAGGGYGSTGNRAPTASTSAAAIGLRSTSLGKVLVDGQGRTLYLFEADKTNTSDCTGGCQSIWPALTATGTPKADAGVTAAKIGTIAAGGGKHQVTYNGHPLYYYAGDRNPGDTAGQGLNQFGAPWYVLGATGSKVDDD